MRAHHLFKSFQSSTARILILKELDLLLHRQELLAIVVVLRVSANRPCCIFWGPWNAPDGGSLFFQGEDVFKFSEQRLARFRNQTMGFVFQFHHLLPEFTALENTPMPALIQGINKTSAIQMATAILLRVGLADRLHQKAADLSGGEQQRVALARALMLSRPFCWRMSQPESG